MLTIIKWLRSNNLYCTAIDKDHKTTQQARPQKLNMYRNVLNTLGFIPMHSNTYFKYSHKQQQQQKTWFTNKYRTDSHTSGKQILKTQTSVTQPTWTPLCENVGHSTVHSQWVQKLALKQMFRLNYFKFSQAIY